MGKKALCLIFAFLLSINSFAAIVSDNDGSAFVTKAEFEALKNNFADQVDNYNDSIDSKIDGAIASYLAARVGKKEKENILNQSWEEISFINGVLNNTFKLPDVNLLFGHSSMHWAAIDLQPPSMANNFYYIVQHTSRTVYKKEWNSVGNVFRNLVISDKPYGDANGKLIWAGQALRYNEKWMINRMVPNWPVSSNQWAFLDRPDTQEFGIEMTNFYSLVEVGDARNWDSVKSSVWPVGYKWKYRGRGTSASWTTVGISFPIDWNWDSASTQVFLDTDDNGKKTKYDHIIEHDKTQMWEVFNPDWSHLIVKSNNSTITANNLKSAATTTSKARTFGLAMHATSAATGDHPRGMDDVSVTQTTVTNSILPSLGLISGGVRSDAIYQDNDIHEVEISTGIKVTKDSPKLHEGFQLLVAKQDDKIEWEPKFSLTHVHNGADSYVDNEHEVDIYFSNGPFTNDITTSNLIKVKINNETTEKNYATTSSRACKVEFEMPENGIVYVKCVPHNAGTYLNSDWIITLDLNSCKTYMLLRE